MNCKFGSEDTNFRALGKKRNDVKTCRGSILVADRSERQVRKKWVTQKQVRLSRWGPVRVGGIIKKNWWVKTIGKNAQRWDGGWGF